MVNACSLLYDSLWERRKVLITKEKKSQQITELAEKFSQSKAVVFTEYKGLTVAEIAALRGLLREVGAEYKVAKNTLIAIASKGTPVEAARDHFVGPTGIAFGFDDPVAAAKKILEYSAKNDKFKVKSGIIDGSFFTADELKEVAKLPPKNVLLSMMAGAFQAPAAKLAGALHATVAQLAYALEAVRNKKSA
ncbi:MAG: 50S ribosomal protein L10 [Alphaproteobacteria bacterium]|uniref:Large ribosomal subunit protein uL10 n=1 Tax=Candidatus Nitrobium versatile TaxID=2884831 RepID=A0A953M2B6_9BACT|nr:50S ribosomal protein L10 [Candidatus Nitrobium versatile]